MALPNNTTGSHNTASGMQALLNNTTGGSNTGVGVNALLTNSTGNNNIGIGFSSGNNLVSGSNNIDIGSAAGAAAESNTIRIGTAGTQTAAFIAGISGTTIAGADVQISAGGQLGIVVSSARYKRDIADMGERTSGLLKLRPVTFRYKNDQSGALQYGLVAEEVAKVYPELVVYGADGKVMTVRYSMLSAMLLNELQKRTAENQRQADQLTKLSAQVQADHRRIAQLQASNERHQAAFEQRLSVIEHRVQTSTPVNF
jgi:hypothetical protein